MCLASFAGHAKAQVVTSDNRDRQALKKPTFLQLDILLPSSNNKLLVTGPKTPEVSTATGVNK